MDCRKIQSLILDGNINKEVKKHLEECKECFGFYEFLERLSFEFKKIDFISPPDYLYKKIKFKIILERVLKITLLPYIIISIVVFYLVKDLVYFKISSFFFYLFRILIKFMLFIEPFTEFVFFIFVFIFIFSLFTWGLSIILFIFWRFPYLKGLIPFLYYKKIWR